MNVLFDVWPFVLVFGAIFVLATIGFLNVVIWSVEWVLDQWEAHQHHKQHKSRH